MIEVKIKENKNQDFLHFINESQLNLFSLFVFIRIVNRQNKMNLNLGYLNGIP